ncbi:MAG TPA: GTPase [Gaiella sp.]|uniref:GTPase n=1 Tax=Gaiella sp. TaxID=2663207 RepID=UPI002D80801C|nr:GTPase [Gaiella sp.]HET9287164.1 GTPase [Gaiella sp.]
MSLDLDARLVALDEAVRVADGRLEPEEVGAGRRVIEKAGARLGLGIESTVAALAGPTGAGKSLLFNALSGGDAAAVGRRRPTTSEARAAVWGDGADTLLDWLDVRMRHRVDGDGLEGLVLLDLPDFDSVETAHRLEVDRIVELVDLLVWVVEPQKYADAALHDRYLRPLRRHADGMVFLLNQADLLSASEAGALRDDATRLLGEDGLRDTPVLVISALTGLGLEELRSLLVERVAARDAAVARLAADVEAAAETLRRWCGDMQPPGVRKEQRERLVAALSEAAGVPRVVEAVGEAHRRRGALATGWPFVRWVRRLKPDPLRRLRLGEGGGDGERFGRTSMPPATDVQRAQVATAVRALADEAGAGLPPPWPRLVRASAASDEARVLDRLDHAVGTADIEPSAPRWWWVASMLQRLVAAVFGVGALWIALAGVAGLLRIEDVVPLPERNGAPIATWLVVIGLAGGLLLASLTRLVNAAGARRRRRSAERALRPGIEAVADELVVGPVERELAAHETLRRSLAVATGDEDRTARAP